MPSQDIPDWATPFRPLFSGGDLHTIAARFWPAAIAGAAESRWFETEPGVRVRAEINRADPRAPLKATLLAVHGLTSCSEARYMLSLGARALAEGFDVIRLNVRNCGGTEAECPTLYHSGLTTDLRAVIDQLAGEVDRLCVLGFSMGGNMALKLAGEWGPERPAHVAAVCGISVPIRLDVCSKRIGEPRNRLYERRFMRQLQETLEKKAAIRPETVDGLLHNRARTIWEFDDRVTAPHFGFRSASDYYGKASAAAYLDRVRTPALLVEAWDDPFIPFEIYRDPALDRNSHLTLLTTRTGGHVGFVDRGPKRFWAEEQALRFFRRALSDGAALK